MGRRPFYILRSGMSRIQRRRRWLKGGYSVELYENDRKKVILKVVDDHVVEEGFEHEELVVQGFDVNLIYEEREGCVGDDVKELPYLFMLMKLWPGGLEE